MKFNTGILSADDFHLADQIIGVDRGGIYKDPDLVISPDGTPYLWRWYIVHDQTKASVYFHIQTGSDPERPLHDHPWDNTSVILSGGYDEIFDPKPWLTQDRKHHYLVRPLRAGDVVHRRAAEAHRLILPPSIPYTMTLFSTGPRIRHWGFWRTDGWHPASETQVTLPDGRAITRKEFRDA